MLQQRTSMVAKPIREHPASVNSEDMSSVGKLATAPAVNVIKSCFLKSSSVGSLFKYLKISAALTRQMLPAADFKVEPKMLVKWLLFMLCENKAFPALKSMRPEVLNTVLPTVVVIAQFSSSLELNVFVSCGFVIKISPYLNVEKYYAGMVLLAMIIVKPS
jgi:hypothetical protein